MDDEELPPPPKIPIIAQTLRTAEAVELLLRRDDARVSYYRVHVRKGPNNFNVDESVRTWTNVCIRCARHLYKLHVP